MRTRRQGGTSLLAKVDMAHRTVRAQHDPPPPRGLAAMSPGPARPLLLVESSPAARGFLQRVLTAAGFSVRSFRQSEDAEQVADDAQIRHAVLRLGLRDGTCLPLVRRLRTLHPAMRIVVVTDVDSFASVVLALRAGADDYLATPIDEGQLIAGLAGRTPALPPVPNMPLGLDRVCWEHVMRVFEQCDRNVTHAAQRLGMHRRSLQRFLGKRAPLPRAPQTTAVAAGRDHHESWSQR
jgi:two-component system response regulator RegA